MLTEREKTIAIEAVLIGFGTKLKEENYHVAQITAEKIIDYYNVELDDGEEDATLDRLQRPEPAINISNEMWEECTQGLRFGDFTKPESGNP